MRQFLASLLTVYGLMGAGAEAATLETEVTPEMAEMGCTARLTGPLEPGDLDQLRPFLERDLSPGWGEEDWVPELVFRNFSPAADFGDGFFVHRLCLNIEGGSFEEAFRIISYLRELARRNVSGIPTGVARGDRCEGACAWLFLSGRFLRFVAVGHYEAQAANAILHPHGTLRLSAPEGVPRVAALLGAVTRRDILIAPHLLAQALAHSPTRPLKVRSVLQAVRWGIEVEPTVMQMQAPRPDLPQATRSACLNAAGLAPEYLRLMPRSRKATATPTEGGFYRIEDALFDAVSGRGYDCEVETATALSLCYPANQESAKTLMTRMVFQGFVTVKLVPRDHEHLGDPIMIDAPCLALFAPATPLADLWPG